MNPKVICVLVFLYFLFLVLCSFRASPVLTHFVPIWNLSEKHISNWVVFIGDSKFSCIYFHTQIYNHALIKVWLNFCLDLVLPIGVLRMELFTENFTQIGVKFKQRLEMLLGVNSMRISWVILNALLIWYLGSVIWLIFTILSAFPSMALRDTQGTQGIRFKELEDVPHSLKMMLNWYKKFVVITMMSKFCSVPSL